MENTFELTRIKLLKGVEISYKKDKDSFTQSSKKYPHADLTTAIDSLKSYLVSTSGRDTVILCQHDCPKEITYDSELAKITITGVSFAGKNENRGVLIMGKYLCLNGAFIAINSPRIRFEADIFGFEYDLEKLCSLISQECYKYLFEGKEAEQENTFES